MAVNDATLRNYLEALQAMLTYSKQKPDQKELDKRRKQALIGDFISPSAVWARMRDARLYSIPQQTYAALYHAVDVHLDEAATGSPWEPYDPTKDSPKEKADATKLLNFTIEEGKRQPYPEKLPFDNIYLAYEGGIALSDEQQIAHLGGAPFLDDAGLVTLLGHLVCWDGHLFEVTRAYIPARDAAAYGLVQVHVPSGEWSAKFSLTPFVVPLIVDLIREHQTFIFEEKRSTGMRLKWKKALKTFKVKKPIPPPYYTIVVKDEIVKKTLNRLKDIKKSWSLSYQLDVAGHERMYIRRGPLPIDPKVADKLVNDRGYKLFTVEEMPADLVVKMAKRGQLPKRKDEWVAVRLVDIDSYRKGPPNAPYVPAIRRIPKGKPSCNSSSIRKRLYEPGKTDCPPTSEG